MGPTWPSVVRTAAWIFVGVMGTLSMVALAASSVRAAPTPLAGLEAHSAPLADTQGVLTGIASWYGPGDGVATQWCTWTLRTTQGCGQLAIQSADTGLIVVAPVVDWCQCYRGEPAERIVDLQLGVVAALGLDPSRGLYQVTTWPVDGSGLPDAASDGPYPPWWDIVMAAAGGIIGWVVAGRILDWISVWYYRRRVRHRLDEIGRLYRFRPTRPNPADRRSRF